MADFFGFLKNIAPTIAGVVGTPAAGIAVEALIKAFDGDEDKANAIMRGEQQLTSDDIARIKIAEVEAATRTKELDITLEQLAVDDRKSARDRQVQMRDWTPNIIGGLVVTACLVINYHVLVNGYPETIPGEVIGRILGTLDSVSIIVMTYFFGSSAGSARKTELIGTAKPQ